LKAVKHFHHPLMISLDQHVSLGTHVSNLTVTTAAVNTATRQPTIQQYKKQLFASMAT